MGTCNPMCNNVARSTINSMPRLTRQRAEEIALGQVVGAAVWVARSLIRTKLCQCIGGNHSMTDDRTGNIRNMLAHKIDQALSKAFSEIVSPRSITNLNQTCTITTRVTGNLEHLDTHDGFAFRSTGWIEICRVVKCKRRLLWE